MTLNESKEGRRAAGSFVVVTDETGRELVRGGVVADDGTTLTVHTIRRSNRGEGEGLGGSVARLRREAGLSQRALAARAGVSHQTLANLESGAAPSMTTLAKVAVALDVPPQSLVS